MDWDDATDGVGRDFSELVGAGPLGWFVIAGVALLPLAAVLAVRRTRLAWLALALWFVTAWVWVVYYAFDLGENPGLGGLYSTILPAVAGWVVLVAGLVRSRRRRSAD